MFERQPERTTTAEIVGSTAPSGAAPASTTAAALAPVPPTVPGYALAASSADVQKQFETVAGQFHGVFAGLTVRTVSKGQQSVGTLVLLGLHPELVGNTEVEQRLVPGMVKGMNGQGATVTLRQVARQQVAVATTKTTNIVAWYQHGVLVLVLGTGADPAGSLAFTKDYLGSV